MEVVSPAPQEVQHINLSTHERFVLRVHSLMAENQDVFAVSNQNDGFDKQKFVCITQLRDDAGHVMDLQVEHTLYPESEEESILVFVLGRRVFELTLKSGTGVDDLYERIKVLPLPAEKMEQMMSIFTTNLGSKRRQITEASLEPQLSLETLEELLTTGTFSLPHMRGTQLTLRQYNEFLAKKESRVRPGPLTQNPLELEVLE
jgi:hypothetical protein